MTEGKQTLKERFADLSPIVRIGAISGLVLFVLILFLVLKPASQSFRKPNAQVDTPLVKADLLLPKPKDRTVEQLNGELIQQGRSIQALKKNIERSGEEQRLILSRLDQALKQLQIGTGSGGVNEEFIEEVRNLQRRIDELEKNTNLDIGLSSSTMSQQHDALDFDTEQAGNEVVEPPKILVVGGSKSVQKKAVEHGERVPYITANAMFEGQLLNGMDAPTDQSAKQTPVPAVIRIKSEAILPNLFNVPDIQECFISVAGYGDMSDERAKMRTEMLSCVVASRTPGIAPRTIEAKVDGYVVGEDGRVGMRGRLVSKQGQLIAKTMLAGVMSGLGDALKPQGIQGLDINPGNRVQTQRYDARVIGESGLAQGLSDTAKSVSQYYLKLADQMMPIVEIDAGRKVTVVLLKGVELK